MANDNFVGLTDAQIAAAASEVDPVLLAQGIELIHAEKEVPLRKALRYHWRAMAWSMFLSLALVMDGYDGAVSNAFFGLPSFVNTFGVVVNGKKGVPANWQSALQNVGIPGGFLGLFLCGWCQERFGSRKTYLGGMCFAILCVFLFVFANSLGMLLAAEAIAACAWAIFNTLTAAYAAEICPIQLRGYSTSFISMCWGMGSFIASGVDRGALNIQGNWGWRMAYAVQWAWPVPLAIAAFFAPESPWWLVRKGRIDDAKKVLNRISMKGYWEDRNIDAYIEVIKHTDVLERAQAKSGSFWEIWKGTNLRRTEIQMGVWACQVFSGTAMTAYAVEFLEDAGMSTTTAFNFGILINGMNLIGCLIDFVLMTRFGRRTLILCGLNVLALMLVLIGVFGSVTPTHATLQGIGACCAVINLAYHASVGPLTYTVAAEVPASRLRARSVAWGRASYTIMYNATAQLTPRMVSAVDWNWGAKAAYFWLGGNLGVTIWAFFRLPETRGLSYAEMEILFANRISARKFGHVKVHDEAAAGDAKFADPEGGDEADEKEKGVVYHNETVQQPQVAATLEG
ncbi:hypothetical protein EHS25_007442 [Saitozyma podzolica]|uniref:Major facilitator superfamily (MFS) profile domain-containing protein n=1 Tax=Saitozyma podzolica TaxID=1890683 RepID=A0A427YPU1_9TREE|nr:hypothetical protein EHS25_007442 [Saitozyma podzolica]